MDFFFTKLWYKSLMTNTVFILEAEVGEKGRIAAPNAMVFHCRLPQQMDN